jgi:hypothetical protein
MSSATFPNRVRSFSAKVDLVDYVLADHVNSLQNEVVALEKSLGDTGSGGTSYLLSRFDATPFSTSVLDWSVNGNLGARLLNIEAGLVNGVSNSPYVRIKGGSIIQPLSGSVGLTLQTQAGTANLITTLSSGAVLGFNVDYMGIPKVGTANVVYVGSSDYNNILSTAASAAASMHPFLLGGL